MGAFFLLIVCVLFLFGKNLVENAIQADKNVRFEERKTRDNFNFVLQNELDYMIRRRPLEFEEQTGMKIEIIANILCARFDKVPYNSELYCAEGLRDTAENAAISYLIEGKGFRANPERFDIRGLDIDLSIPSDYIIQGKLFLLGFHDLENLTGLDYKRLLEKFSSINEFAMRVNPEGCNQRVKGMMIRYQMGHDGRQFYGMHDDIFLNTSDVIREVNDKFNLDDCKNWGTPLKFVV